MTEQSLYLDEDVPYTPLAYLDNTPVLELLTAKPYGLLPLLSEEVRLPQGSDAKFLAKATMRQRANRHVFGESAAADDTFTVHHYARPVRYDVAGFVEKNADRLSRNVHELLADADDERTRSLFPRLSQTDGGRQSTVEEQFRAQLTQLMTTLDQAQPHFIR